MADIVHVKYNFPPNFTGVYAPEIKQGFKQYTVHATCKSDGTGLNTQVLAHRADLLTPNGNVPGKLVVDRIDYDIDGMTVIVRHNNVDDEKIARLSSGAGFVDFTASGGFVPSGGASDFDTGDIVIDTENASDEDTFSIDVSFHVKD